MESEDRRQHSGLENAPENHADERSKRRRWFVTPELTQWRQMVATGQYFGPFFSFPYEPARQLLDAEYAAHMERERIAAHIARGKTRSWAEDCLLPTAERRLLGFPYLAVADDYPELRSTTEAAALTLGPRSNQGNPENYE